VRTEKPQKAVCNGQRGLTWEARRSGAGSQEHMRVTAPPEYIHMAPMPVLLHASRAGTSWEICVDMPLTLLFTPVRTREARDLASTPQPLQACSSAAREASATWAR